MKRLDGSRGALTEASPPGIREFNLNRYVRVRLNERGYKHLAKSFNEIMGRFGERRTAADYKAMADAEGFTRFQMWEFMHQFGPVTTIGFAPYFETTVRFEDADLVPAPSVAQPAEAPEAEQSSPSIVVGEG